MELTDNNAYNGNLYDSTTFVDVLVELFWDSRESSANGNIIICKYVKAKPNLLLVYLSASPQNPHRP